MLRTFKSLIVLIVVVVSSQLYAERLYPLFPGAIELEPTFLSEVDEWVMPLSKNKKINGDWTFEKSLMFSGSLSSVTYRIHTKKRLLDISRFYQTFAESGEKKVLFTCKGRVCGSSNEWANGHFGVKELYGSDMNQRYWALNIKGDYLLLYLIERGNGRIYLHAETLTNAKKCCY